MTAPLIERLQALQAAATPAPWRWAGSVKRPMLTTVHHGLTYVMGFVRSGMHGAQPTFQKYETIGRWGSGHMVPTSELAVREVPYRDDIVDIDHPDARLLVEGRNALPLLLAVAAAAVEYDRVVATPGGAGTAVLPAWHALRAALDALQEAA